jgi:glutathione peroxidase-family protein
MLRRVFSSVFSLGTLSSKYRVDVEAGSSIPDHADAEAGKEKPTDEERARQEMPLMHPPPPPVHGVPTAPATAAAVVQYAARAPSLVAAESIIGGIIDRIVGSIEHEDRWPNPAGAITEGEVAEQKDKVAEIQEEAVAVASANERTEVTGAKPKDKPKKYTPAMNGVSGIIRLYDFSAPDANGDVVDFARYCGKVVLVINVASRCDFTGPMYDHIRELQNRFGADDDFKILAFPCNQFLKREPLSAVEVCRFAEDKGIKVGATVHIYDKVHVAGKSAHPLWKWLKAERSDPACWGREIKWNFTKFLIDRQGRVVRRVMHFNKMPEQLIADLLGFADIEQGSHVAPLIPKAAKATKAVKAPPGPHPSLNACRRAAIAVDNRSSEEAGAWLDEHIDDAEIDEPIQGDATRAIVEHLRKLRYEDEKPPVKPPLLVMHFNKETGQSLRRVGSSPR